MSIKTDPHHSSRGMCCNKEDGFVVSARLPIGAGADQLVKTFFVSVAPAEVTAR